MKKIALLVFSVVLGLVACTKGNTSEGNFAGIGTEAGEKDKLFIVNQGSFPGSSTLDLIDLKTKVYQADIFGSANPEVVQGLGNTANDIAAIGGKLWVLLNASNQIAIINIADGKLVRYLAVDSPRYIIREGSYAYVSSYGAAVNGSYYDVEGKVYRISLSDYSIKSVKVGYQPEGLAVLDGKLYVANSGGYQATPSSDVSVIDLTSFTKTTSINLPVKNLNRLFSEGGKLWITTYACYNSDWSQVIAPMSLGSFTSSGTYTTVENVHANVVTLCNGVIYAIGNSQELSGGYDNCLYRYRISDGNLSTTHFAGSALQAISYPYGIAVNPASGEIYIADANFKGDSKVFGFDSSLNKLWEHASGIGTGPMLVY